MTTCTGHMGMENDAEQCNIHVLSAPLSAVCFYAAGKASEEVSSGAKKPVKDDRGAEKDGDLLLAGSSAGSAKSRHGGSVYDLLVAEIKV